MLHLDRLFSTPFADLACYNAETDARRSSRHQLNDHFEARAAIAHEISEPRTNSDLPGNGTTFVRIHQKSRIVNWDHEYVRASYVAYPSKWSRNLNKERVLYVCTIPYT